MEIQMWAQMFFEDGTVSEGKRFPAEWLDEGSKGQIDALARKLLNSTGRDEGFLLLWGAGNMVFTPFSISSSQASESSS